MVLSLSGPPINSTMQSAPGLFWFLMSSCNGSIEELIAPKQMHSVVKERWWNRKLYKSFWEIIEMYSNDLNQIFDFINLLLYMIIYNDVRAVLLVIYIFKLSGTLLFVNDMIICQHLLGEESYTVVILFSCYDSRFMTVDSR